MGEFTDLIFILMTKLARWFNVRGEKVCFLIWAVAVLYWIARNYSLGLISQTGGCIFSFCFYLYGYYNWKKKNFGVQKYKAD